MTNIDGEEPLVHATVDRARLGENWPDAIVALIEAHEKVHIGLANRKIIHVLLDRYAARYFPDVAIEHEHRRYVIRKLRSRYFTPRLNTYFRRLASVL